MLNKKILIGSTAIPVIVAIAMITSLPETVETTYNYENGSFPPPMSLSFYGDVFVDSVKEASEIVGYTVDEPKLPKGVDLQLIGVLEDRTVVMFASPHPITSETLDKEFMWKLQGLQITYEKLPERLSHLDTDTIVQKWAADRGVDALVKNDKVQAVKPISVGHGHEDEFDMPGRFLTSDNGILKSTEGFYPPDKLEATLE